MHEQVTLERSANAGRLFSVGQITLATFLGAPLAGCLLLAQNYRGMGAQRAVGISVLAGIVSTALLLMLSFVLPDNFPNMVLPIASCVGMRQIAVYSQGERISENLTSGGRKRPWWLVVAIGLGSFGLIFCAILVLVGP